MQDIMDKINENFPATTKEKRKKRRDRKQCVYLQEWLEKSNEQAHTTTGHYGGTIDIPPPAYWPSHTPPRHLFATLSDPAVTLPLGYSLEPVLCPVLQPQPSYQPIHVQQYNKVSRCRRQRPQRPAPHHPPPPPPAAAVTDPGLEFASLPPPTQPLTVPEAAQRRFSDPGLGPAVTSSGDDSGSDDAATSAIIGSAVVEQVASLHSMMKNMARELQDLRTEVESLKLQSNTWRNMARTYEPGMLSDLVREVRDAARIREDAVMARVCSMLSSSDKVKWSNHVLQTSDTSITSSSMAVGAAQGSREIEELKNQLKEANTEKSRTEDRLLNVEAQLQRLHLNNSHEGINKTVEGRTFNVEKRDGHVLFQELQQLKDDNLKLTCELQEALATRKSAEENAEKMERLVDILRKKINGVIQEEKQQQPLNEVSLLEQSPSSLENTSESLVSVGSSSTGRSSSLQSPQVTMSGPVTDL